MGNSKLPEIIVTGASGFIGRHFLEAAKNTFSIFAIARRSQVECNAPRHKNIEWHIVDITDKDELKKTIDDIGSRAKIDYVLHLAGYYDFECLDSPEYIRTNVEGTKNILEMGRKLNIKRFVFASSLTVCDFRKCEMPVTEESPPNAKFPYARSKKMGEEMLKDYSSHFSGTAIRFAAIFSDWCEYEPLYSLMSTWVSGKWNSRIIAGKGDTAITYIHIKCAVLFLLKVFQRSSELKKFDILIASSSNTQSHIKLYKMTTRLYFGRSGKPIFIPKFLAAIGIMLRCAIGKILKKRPFEKIWMVSYIDRFISTNPEYSFNSLPFKIRERYHLPRRMIYLIENMKSFPQEWHSRNMNPHRKDPVRPNLIIGNVMNVEKERIVNMILTHLITSPDYPNYQSLEPDRLRWFIHLVYNLLMGSVRNGDRHSVISYYRYLASIRKKGGFPLEELKSALLKLGDIIIEELGKIPGLIDMGQYLNNHIRLTLEMAADEVDDAYSEIPDHSNVDEKNGRLALGEEMESFEKKIVALVQDFLISEDNKSRFPNYRKKPGEELKWNITLIYKLLIDCIRYNDNASFISYISYLATIRRKEGFPAPELTDAVCSTVNIAVDKVKNTSLVQRSEEILEISIRPNLNKVPDMINKVYSESVMI
ncbi:MAG: NAD(P)-dependent oxidoreductase [Acidobacteriota bacterium]